MTIQRVPQMEGKDAELLRIEGWCPLGSEEEVEKWDNLKEGDRLFRQGENDGGRGKDRGSSAGEEQKPDHRFMAVSVSAPREIMRARYYGECPRFSHRYRCIKVSMSVPASASRKMEPVTPPVKRAFAAA